MPAPLSSANILQEPLKQAGCAIATTGKSQGIAGATRADRDGFQENKENVSGRDLRDLETQRFPLHRIAAQSENAPGHRNHDVNPSLSRGNDKTRTLPSVLSQNAEQVVNPPLLTDLDSQKNNELESVLCSVQCKEDPSFPPRFRAVQLLPDHRYLNGSIVMMRSCAQRRPVNGLHLYSL